MRNLKKILLVLGAVLIVASIGGYVYFNRKFTPDKNYLQVEKESGKIPITWAGNNKNALLLPITIDGDTTSYYLQFDTGSPTTVFYTEAIKSIKAIAINNGRAKASFHIGNTKISSEHFNMIDRHQRVDSFHLIGTLGTDMLDRNRTLINFKENFIVFNLNEEPAPFKNSFIDFSFKKRRIIIQGILNGEKRNFLFDTGTSAYELLTTKEEWERLKLCNSKIIEEKSQSWNNTLTVFTAPSRNKVLFNKKEIPLNEVSYVDGFSKMQYLLMKFSGMNGMLGNKIFLKNQIFLDCAKHKMSIN